MFIPALMFGVSAAAAQTQEPSAGTEPAAASEPAAALGAVDPEADQRAVPIVRSKSVDGLGPDAQLTGGIGFGLETKLDNFFLARARLGALYAAEPWIVNLGFTAEVGALAGLGWGGELELSRGGTLFGSAGVARVDERRWLTHLSVGFAIFGLEWQHVFGGSQPHNALLLEVRLPLGLWWLQKRQEKAEAESAAAARARTPPQVIQRPIANPPPLIPGAPPTRSTSADSSTLTAAPSAALSGASAGAPSAALSGTSAGGPSGALSGTSAGASDAALSGTSAGGSDAALSGASAGAPSAALSGASAGASDAALSGTSAGARGAASSGAAASGAAAPSPTSHQQGSRATSDIAALEAELAGRMADAQRARERGDHLAEAMALARAYALRATPGIALQLAAAELALGKPRAALADWQRVGDLQQLSAEDSARASELHQQIAASIAQLRLSLSGAASEQDVVWIDGAPEPTASRGYDVPLDPGEHKLQVLRNQRVLIERTIHAEPGKLVRLDLELPPTVPSPNL